MTECRESSSASDRKCRNLLSREGFDRNTTSAARSPVYVGRIDKEQRVRGTLRILPGLSRESSSNLSLVLIGNSLLPVPNDPRIRHLGFLDDADKFDALAAADLLIMPSVSSQSLSMVALEALGHWPAGFGQWQMRCVEGPVHSQQCGLYVLNRFRSLLRRFELSSGIVG